MGNDEGNPVLPRRIVNKRETDVLNVKDSKHIENINDFRNLSKPKKNIETHNYYDDPERCNKRSVFSAEKNKITFNPFLCGDF